jgi:hypothetical protein
VVRLIERELQEHGLAVDRHVRCLSREGRSPRSCACRSTCDGVGRHALARHRRRHLVQERILERPEARIGMRTSVRADVAPRLIR